MPAAARVERLAAGNAEELLEHLLAQLRRNARALVGDRRPARGARPRRRAPTRIVVPAGEYLLALSSSMYSTSATAAGSTASGGRSSSSVDLHAVTPQHRVGARQRLAHDRLERDRAEAERLRRIRPIGGRQPFDEAVQAIGLLVDHLQQLAPALARQRRGADRIARADQRRHRRLDRGQRRPQVVRQRVEQRRLQLLVAARRLGLARALERRAELLIELLDLAPPLLGFELPPLGPRRQLADDDRGDGEGDERDPVVRGPR